MSASESRSVLYQVSEDCVSPISIPSIHSTSPFKRRGLDTNVSSYATSITGTKSTPKKRARKSITRNSTNNNNNTTNNNNNVARGATVAAPDRFIPSRSNMDLDLSRMALFTKENTANISASSIYSNASDTAGNPSNSNSSLYSDASANTTSAAGRFVGELGYESCLQSTMLRSSSSRSGNLNLNINMSVSFENRAPTDTGANSSFSNKVLSFSTSQENLPHVYSPTRSFSRPSLLHNSAMRGVPPRATSRFPACDNGLMHQNSSGGGVRGVRGVQSRRRRQTARYIAPTPYKILDAPNIQEDFYFNLLDWGATGTLAVALHDTVYLWNSDTGAINRLLELNDPSGTGTATARDDFVTSVSWSADGRFLAVGTNRAAVQVWDAMSETRLRSWTSHAERVSALAWKDWTLTSGGRDSRIIHNDLRAASRTPYAVSAAHTQEVCGLKWSPNGQQLASGGNDNLVHTWDASRVSVPRLRLDAHRAAVKAIAWCPHQSNILATGGGTADRMLRFWNTSGSRGICTKHVDTKSQVSGIAWSGTDMECVTSHGFSQNQLTVWKYASLTKLAELKGHTQRVLHLALSPDGTTVVSGAADESLRFWKVFESNSSRRAARAAQAEKTSVLSHHRVVWR